MGSITIQPVVGIDEQWYGRLKPILAEVGETFVTLMPSDEKLQRLHAEFVSSGYQSISDLIPEVPEAEKLQDSRDLLQDLRRDIESGEKIAAVRDLYLARIDETLANIAMVLAAKTGDADTFFRTNDSIYGRPDAEIFAACCAWIRQQVQLDDDKNISPLLRDELLRLIPDIPGDIGRLLPSDEVFQRIKSLHFQPGGYIEQLFRGTTIPDDAVITPILGDPIVRQVIHNIGSSFDLVDSPTGLWAVLQSQKQIVRPSNMALAKGPFMGIVCHEVGSHLLESTNGSAGPLKLLELGLDRYEAGNEGRAFLREQIMFDRFEDYVDQPLWSPTKASWEYRVAIHMVISLALGLYGDRQYGFAELYHLLTMLFRFWTAKRGQQIDDNIINQGAWSMAVRALKGTDGRGGAYVKDIVYLEGNLRCWQAAQIRPELIFDGDKGKFDIANPQHVQRLTALGILSV